MGDMSLSCSKIRDWYLFLWLQFWRARHRCNWKGNALNLPSRTNFSKRRKWSEGMKLLPLAQEWWLCCWVCTELKQLRRSKFGCQEGLQTERDIWGFMAQDDTCKGSFHAALEGVHQGTWPKSKVSKNIVNNSREKKEFTFEGMHMLTPFLLPKVYHEGVAHADALGCFLYSALKPGRAALKDWGVLP